MRKLLLLLFLVPVVSFGQTKEGLQLCLAMQSSNFISDSEAENALYRILNTIGASKNFVLTPCSEINNAAATSYKGIRYILYDKEFMRLINSRTNDWASLAILAHEVGHHINGHALDITMYAGGVVEAKSLANKRKQELEADEFAGFVLAKLGASLNGALAFTRIFKEKDDTYDTHPSKSKRVIAVRKGYYKAGGNSSIANTNNTPTKYTRKNTVKSVEEYYADLVRVREKREAEYRARKLAAKKAELHQKEMEIKKPMMEANLKMKSNRELFYFSDVAVKIALLRKSQSESPSSLSLKSLNKFKYVVLLESKINYPNIKKSIKKYWKNDLPELIIVENKKSIPEDLKSNPNLAIYLDVSIEAFNEMFTKSNFYLYENNSNLLYSINQKRKSANKAIKLLVEEIQNNNYQFDENLVKPYILKKPVPEIKKITQDKIKVKEPLDKVKDGFQTMSKDDAVKEIKVLKELYDSEILTKDEYLKKAAELKKIILGN